MIKAAQKNVYILKDTHSEIFEEAIFIVKKEIPALSDYTLQKEAERILREHTSFQNKRKK